MSKRVTIRHRLNKEQLLQQKLNQIKTDCPHFSNVCCKKITTDFQADQPKVEDLHYDLGLDIWIIQKILVVLNVLCINCLERDIHGAAKGLQTCNAYVNIRKHTVEEQVIFLPQLSQGQSSYNATVFVCFPVLQK